MPTDDLSSQQQTHFSAGAEGRVPGRTPDELDEAAERLEESSWDDFEVSGARPGPTRGLSHDGGTRRILAVLGQQLEERPLPTLLLAVAAGWLVGKILR